LSGLGHAYALAGRLAEALALLESAIEQRTAISAMAVGQTVHVNRLAEAYLAVGRAEQAVERARLALDLARSYKEPANEAFALRLLGEIASHRDPANVEAAQSHYCEALALAIELGMRPLIAHCHLGLGKLYRRTGKREQAQEHLNIATTMYREMGMTYWLEKAKAELGQRAEPTE
jgi:tetratricopeptide (TPR) repeat protein